MKTTAIALVALVAAGAASAGPLSRNAVNEAADFGVNVESLTTAQAFQVAHILDSEENNTTKKGQIAAVVNGGGVATADKIAILAVQSSDDNSTTRQNQIDAIRAR